MDFAEEIRVLASRAEKSCKHIKGEETTKQSLIVPFIRGMGYDTYDPIEVIFEFFADIGTKKGETVDIAIMRDERPIILVECKRCDRSLDGQHSSQPFRYFSTTDARVAILTNGIVYRFFTDLEKSNQMDAKPFLEINLLDLQEDLILELKRFTKEKFDIGEIMPAAAELKYTREIKLIMAEQLRFPTDNFVRFFASQVYDGNLMQRVMGQFREVTKRALKQFINEQINERLKLAMEDEGQTAAQEKICHKGLKSDKKKTEPQADGSKPTSTHRTIRLLDLISAGFIYPPQELSVKFKDRFFSATVQKDGTVLFMDKSYKSLSVAGGLVRNEVNGLPPDGRPYWQTNGWTFWQFQDPETGTLQPIDIQRQRFKKRQSNPEIISFRARKIG